MESSHAPLARLSSFLHRRLLWLLVGSYLLAGVAPDAGLRLRGVGLGEVRIAGEATTVSLPSLLLGLLLFNAGLGVELRGGMGLLGSSRILLLGLLANLAVPMLFILGVSLSLAVWHNPAEVQSILVGLALIASMPVAGSSTAWSQNADGDLAVSLGLVVVTTLCSPLTTPAVLHAVGWVAEGQFSECLHRLADGGASGFLLGFVVIPSLAGMAARSVVGGRAADRLKPALKVTNTLVLLTLCYANASVALPRTFADPDWDFLAVMLLIVTALCVSGFVAGSLIADWSRADSGRRVALMFGLGMTNNGTGLVLATTALSHLPDVMLPVIFYNLVQHLVAGVAGRANASRLHPREAGA